MKKVDEAENGREQFKFFSTELNKITQKLFSLQLLISIQ